MTVLFIYYIQGILLLQTYSIIIVKQLWRLNNSIYNLCHLFNLNPKLLNLLLLLYSTQQTHKEICQGKFFCITSVIVKLKMKTFSGSRALFILLDFHT